MHEPDSQRAHYLSKATVAGACLRQSGDSWNSLMVMISNVFMLRKSKWAFYINKAVHWSCANHGWSTAKDLAISRKN